MANTRTLAQLRASVQMRGQYENSSDLTPAILAEYINEAIAETYDILVAKWADYYTTSTTVAVVASTASYALPADFYKLRKVEIADGARRIRLYPHDLEASHRWTSPIANRGYRYRMQAGNLVLVPTPTAPETLAVYYVPFAARLASDSDTFDGINGYEELVVQLALKRCRAREELPQDDVDAEVGRLIQRVRTAADSRDIAEPFYLDPAGPPRAWDDDWEDW